MNKLDWLTPWQQAGCGISIGKDDMLVIYAYQGIPTVRGIGSVLINYSRWIHSPEFPIAHLSAMLETRAIIRNLLEKRE